MSLWGKRVLGTLVVIVIIGVFAWVNRTEVMLTGIEIFSGLAMTPGPNQAINWDRGADGEGRAPADRPPNIVLILADDLGWNDLTFRGGGVAGGSVPTPNIDSLAAEGVTFSNGYAANGTCAPSRALTLSGTATCGA